MSYRVFPKDFDKNLIKRVADMNIAVMARMRAFDDDDIDSYM